MKTFALMTVLLAAAVPVLAAHSIGIYADEAATSCEITDTGGAKTLYIVETNQVQPAGGSVWKLAWDAGVTMIYVSDSTPYFRIGNAQDGIQIAYVPCGAGTFLIDTVTMMSFGTSAPCSRFRLVDEPTRGLSILRCGSFDPMSFVPGEAIVNANGTCSCTVATEQATWGSVKALYH
jgi:hypothetical protein